ncbi:hypothetical protein C5167_041659 [Papaver somniferum]|nr:hypothetical protein C5167_041659 [Papaver somniferum]
MVAETVYPHYPLLQYQVQEKIEQAGGTSQLRFLITAIPDFAHASDEFCSRSLTFTFVSEKFMVKLKRRTSSNTKFKRKQSNQSPRQDVCGSTMIPRWVNSYE